MRISVHDLQEMKCRGERIPMLTAYDYTSAQLVEQAGVPIILVGDSLGMVMLGYDSTVPVTLDDMLHHIKAVVRGSKRALVVGDMPFMTYQHDRSDAMRNAGRMLQEGGCQAVKLEGGEHMAETVRRLVEVGIPVQGHIGFTPQSVNTLGMKVQGRSREMARKLLNDAVALEQAGAFSIVLELVPAPLARAITERIKIPTIGIGAGKWCDGQVQVFHDLLGLYQDFTPKHTRHYAEVGTIIREAVSNYAQDVRGHDFPTGRE
ncbi:MAG: 3-methyl-2-oxobutanoate hydroxymethyltransferase, partial [Chloroflexi bacterium]|nr:3-methyl-2-oxobutanoate hydroxymethyltransferase [Chloroflexota bacterium]